MDGAFSGQDATTYSNPNHPVWNSVLSNLTAAGVSTNQVQVVWLKEALAQTSQSFPQHALTLQSNLESIVINIKAKFPYAGIVFVGSRARSYADPGQSHPAEPVAFESGFATKWMIEKQIRGDASLRFTGTNPPAPYLAWGPYFWIDGLKTRSDGMIWECSDLVNDQTHPSTTGVTKVSGQLLAFFKTDPTSTPWYLRANGTNPPTCTVTGPSLVTVGNSAQFIANTTGSIREVVWNFDDGDCFYSTNTPVVFTHSKWFRVPGAYKLRATVTDNNNNTATGSLTVTVP